MKSFAPLLVGTLTCLIALENRAQTDSMISVTPATNGLVGLSIQTFAGNSYRVFSSQNLSNWTTLNHILGNGEVTNFYTGANRPATYYYFEAKPNPLYGLNFFVNTNSKSMEWINANRLTDPTNSSLMEKLATNSISTWLTGTDESVFHRVQGVIEKARLSGQIPIFTLYNIPYRDCGNFSSGGAVSGEAYIAWIEEIARAIYTNLVIIILEPDALALLDCATLSAEQAVERKNLIKRAVNILKTEASTALYIDSGHSNWKPADVMANILKEVGIEQADGFALNVSNFQRDNALISYGSNVSRRINDAHFIIDSGRNGSGPLLNDPIYWCNPPGRALGKRPTWDTGHPLVDAYLWIKDPSESDGNCRPGDPPAGAFYPSYALGLSERASY